MENKISTKIKEAKERKKNNLLEAGYQLFSTKGVTNTSVQDIVNKANIAKGTFYLYFKDKYALEEAIVIHKSKQLFDEALTALKKQNIKDLDKRVIFVIDEVIDKLQKMPHLLKIIGKNISFGVFSDKVREILSNEEISIIDYFKNAVKDANLNLKNPEITFYMIIELTGSTCYNCITSGKPININDFKPFLHDAITKLLKP